MKANNRGVTLLEMMIVLACFGVVVIGTIAIMQQTSISSLQLNAWNQLTTWGQQSVDDINLDLTQARLIYQNDALGQAYLNVLAATVFLPLANSALPLINPAGKFEPDTAVSYTGNDLLFIKEFAPITTDMGAGDIRRIDRYCLIHYYLNESPDAIGNKSTSLRLIRWESIPYADYNQVIAVTDPVSRSNIVMDLWDAGITYLWTPRNMPDNAFYPIDIGGNIWALDSWYTIQTDSVQPVIASLGHGFASVAWNNDTTFWAPDTVPEFGIASAVGKGFPHGLEIQVIGPTSARQILIRLVLAYVASSQENIASNESTTIATMHEF